MTKEIKAKDISEAIGTILAKLCYPGADELGADLAERTSLWRRKNALNVLEKANKKYDRYAVTGREHAHPRLAHKVVEESSWTDNDYIQEMWAGLLASSCTEEGSDESNLIFINVLSQLTSVQATILNYACERTDKEVTKAGWIIAAGSLTVELDKLVEITGISDFHRLDRELDYMRALELIVGGFDPYSTAANVTPTALGLQMYVRCQGYVGSPVEYFGLRT